MGIQRVTPDTDIEKILAIIEQDAAVVIENVLSQKILMIFKVNFNLIYKMILRVTMNLLVFKPRELVP